MTNKLMVVVVVVVAVSFYVVFFSMHNPSRKNYPGYDTKQSNGDIPVMLELWGMLCTYLLPSLPGSLNPGVAAPESVLSMG